MPHSLRLNPLYAALLIALGGSAQAATLTVTSNLDDGTDCTLREAVEAINAGANQNGCSAAGAYGTNDTIVFAPALINSTITLTDQADSDIEINKALTITGPVAGDPTGLTIERSAGASNPFRLFEVTADVPLTLENLTLTGGDAGSGNDGGGVLASGDVTLTNSTVSNNSADNIGGGVRASGDVTLTNSIVSNNSAGARGGGIDASGSVMLTNSTVSDNTGDLVGGGSGGGVNALGDVTLNSSTISGNAASDGGGFYARGNVTLTNSTVTGNMAVGRGGGGSSVGLDGMFNVTLTNSTISGNTANDSNGGGLAVLGFDGSTPYVHLYNSTVSGNTADENGGGLSVAGFNSGAFEPTTSFVYLYNSTVSGNTADENGGGGFFQDSSRVYLINTTVSGNSASEVGGGLAVVNEYFENLVLLANSILSGNLADNSDPDLYTDAPDENDILVYAGYNVLGTDVTITDPSGNDTNIVNDNPKLDPLADNGCVTPAGALASAACVQTMALQSDSPALDAASQDVCDFENIDGLDQRGFPRGIDAVDGADSPEEGDCDIGAYEAGPLLRASKTVSLLADNDSDGQAGPGDTLRYTLTIDNNGATAASNVQFSDSPDSNTTLLAGSVITSQGSVTTGNTAGDTTIGIDGGVLAASASITVMFDVLINDPQDPFDNAEVCNQGQVSSDNTGTVLTDDPTITVELADPTCLALADGKILIDKVTEPSGSLEVFTFTPSYNRGTPFDLADATAPNDSGLLTPGTYTVAELVPAGWDLTEISCDDDDSTDSTTPVAAGDTGEATVNVSAGETVTCTFTNTQRGTIIVAKQTLPAGDLTAFAFTGDVNGSLRDGETAQASVVPGQYTSTETVPSGWDLTAISCDDTDSTVTPPPVAAGGDGTATFNVSAGETVTCTFTNSQRGQIEIRKQTLPAGAPGAFDFTGDLGTFPLSDGDSTVLMDLPTGTYAVSETDPTPAFDLTDIACDDPRSPTPSIVDIANRTAVVELDPAEFVICSFINSQRAELNISVDVSGYALGTEFDFSTGGGLDPVSFSLQDGETQTFSNLVAGQTYTVNEQPPPNWVLDEVICSEPPPVCEVGSVIVTPEPGQTVNATFRFRVGVSGSIEPQNIPSLNGWGLGGLIGFFGLAVMRLWRRR